MVFYFPCERNDGTLSVETGAGNAGVKMGDAGESETVKRRDRITISMMMSC